MSVLIAHLGKMSFVLNKQKANKAGGILIFDVKLDTDQYILINVHKTETEQLKNFKEF